MKRHRLPAALCLALFLGLVLPAAQAACTAWPEWQQFKQAMLSADGRVIDYNTPQQHTVSEGQAYALFFALVAGDRAAFERILQWTENNLAAGDLTARLPAWQWGRLADGGWGVIDANPASDADLWIAYALGEAGRLWDVRRYRVLSTLVANRVLREETANIPGLGLTLLPGPVGFTPAPGQWRLNPSYVPLQQMRWLAQADPAPAWQALVKSSIRLIRDTAPRGYSPDWVLYQAGKGFQPDAQTEASGSYNSIRVYLWAGMLDVADPERASILDTLRPMARRTAEKGAPPESVDTRSGESTRDGPPGFSGALLPFLEALGDTAALQVQRQRAQKSPQGKSPAYYDSVLKLFGQGYLDQRYRFDVNGRLLIDGDRACAARS